MFTHIFHDWHFWQGTQFMCSEENAKRLYAFDNIDACINWLFLNGHKDAARSLNKAKHS